MEETVKNIPINWIWGLWNMCQLLIAKTVIKQYVCLIFRVLWSSFHLQVVLYLHCFHISDDCATINTESKGSSCKSASEGSMHPPAGSKHSHQNQLLVVSDTAFWERLFFWGAMNCSSEQHSDVAFLLFWICVLFKFAFYAVNLQAQKPLKRGWTSQWVWF